MQRLWTGLGVIQHTTVLCQNFRNAHKFHLILCARIFYHTSDMAVNINWFYEPWFRITFQPWSWNIVKCCNHVGKNGCSFDGISKKKTRDVIHPTGPCFHLRYGWLSWGKVTFGSISQKIFPKHYSSAKKVIFHNNSISGHDIPTKFGSFPVKGLDMYTIWWKSLSYILDNNGIKY